MGIYELAAMTWEEVAGLAPSRTVAVLPVGATEAHGPHLPVAADVIIAEAMARAGAERLSAGGYEVLILPSLCYTPVPFAAGFAGSIGISEGTLRATVSEIANALGACGVCCLALANAHLDPAHVNALRSAVADSAGSLAGRPPVVAFADITRRNLASRLSEEFRSGACHAGQYETSILLACRPDVVREGKRAGLGRVANSLTTAMREGKTTFAEAGGTAAYFGDPASASAAEGVATISVLGELLADSVLTSLAAQ
jgi:creatinine amidohydrolase